MNYKIILPAYVSAEVFQDAFNKAFEKTKAEPPFMMF